MKPNSAKRVCLSWGAWMCLSATTPSHAQTAPAPRETPELRVAWNDGKTTLEFERAEVNVSSRLQLRWSQSRTDGAEDIESFRVRRARTKVDGWLYSKTLTYELEVDWTDRLFQDLYFNWDVSRNKAFQVRAGQYKVPFGRQRMTSSARQQFVDRSVVTSEFTEGRDVGVQLWGQVAGERVEYRVGVFNGAGQNRTRNDNDKYQYDARIMWQPFGDVKYSESDFEATHKPLLAIAANLEHNDGRGATEGNDLKRRVVGVDVAFKYRGLSFVTEAFLRRAQPEMGERFRSTGYYVQAGYFVVRDRLEVAGRVASLDPADLVPGDDHREAGLAASYFHNKHNLSLKADLRRVEEAKRANDEVRVQLQVVF